MINAIKNFISKNTGLLIRIDDIAENMNWKLMDKCESAFDKLNIRPLLGIIPNNKEAPKKKNPEANAPSIKYLRPASDDFKESFFVEARTYNANDCNSKPK